MSETLSLLFDPLRFFSDWSDERNLVGPFLVVLAFGVSNAISSVIFLEQARSNVPAEVVEVFVVGQLIGVGSVIVSAFITWLLLSVFVHTILTIRCGVLSFRRTVLFLGWGFLPKTLSGVATAGAMTYILDSTAVPGNVAEIIRLAQAVQTSTPFLIAGVLGVGFTLWSTVLWMYGMKVAHDIDIAEAMYTVLPPAGFMIVFQVLKLTGLL